MLRNKILSTKDYVTECVRNYTDNESQLLSEDAARRAQNSIQESSKNIYDEREKSIQRSMKFAAFSEEVKEVLLGECINRLYGSVLETEHVDENQKTIAKSLVNKFIKENGVDKLLNSFRTKNVLLSEYSRIVSKYHKQIMETAKEDNEDTLTIEPEIKDNFFDELDMVKPDDVIVNIRTRVSDAVQEFIDKNTEDKLDIKEIIQSVQDRVTTAKIDEVKESYSMLGKQAISKIRQKPKNVFSCMIESTAESVLKNDVLKQHYMTEGKLNLDSIVENCKVMYTLLEMVNTTQMIKIDEAYIRDLLDGMK